MKLIKIKNDFINAAAINVVGLSDSNFGKLMVQVASDTHTWSFTDRKTARAERDRVLREWKAKSKPIWFKARVGNLRSSAKSAVKPK